MQNAGSLHGGSFDDPARDRLERRSGLGFVRGSASAVPLLPEVRLWPGGGVLRLPAAPPRVPAQRNPGRRAAGGGGFKRSLRPPGGEPAVLRIRGDAAASG